MPVIDAQVHAYERDHPGRPWAGHLHGPAEVTGDDMVRAMDEVGVDGALLVSPWSLYRFDAGYALEVWARHPDRFGVIKPIDPSSDGIVGQVDAWAATPGTVGIRLVIAPRMVADPDRGGLDAAIDAAARHGMPVNVLCWGRLEMMDELAEAHPDASLVIDHLGLVQPFEPPVPADPFGRLDPVLALARHPNVAIKVTGACTLSRQGFPFDDLWDPLTRVFDAFGFERCLWGTDWTRATELVTYREGVEAFTRTDRLSTSERDLLMGGSLERIYRWSPST